MMLKGAAGEQARNVLHAANVDPDEMLEQPEETPDVGELFDSIDPVNLVQSAIHRIVDTSDYVSEWLIRECLRVESADQIPDAIQEDAEDFYMLRDWILENNVDGIVSREKKWLLRLKSAILTAFPASTAA